VYAVVNAIPAIALCLYGFLTPTMSGSLAFGAGEAGWGGAGRRNAK
jgi:beta-carotene 3-hydroxylase